MLPNAYAPAAAVLLVVGGALACFAGYRLFRVVLAIYGFILGAMLASSMMGATNTFGMVLAALVGGIAGAVILTFAYFVGIALLGAGLGATVAHVVWTEVWAVDPPAIAVILLAVLGAIGAMMLQRYVIIVSTAFSGAWMLLVGGLALTASGAAAATRTGPATNVWILYPFTPAPGHRWVGVAWIVLGTIGALVQLGITGRSTD